MTGLLLALLSYLFPAGVRVSMPEQTKAEREATARWWNWCQGDEQ